MPEEIILEEEFSQNFFFFILKGEVEIYIPQKHKNNTPIGIKKLFRGDFFGETAFFNQHAEKLNVKTKVKTKILMINSEDFQRIIKLVAKDDELYCQIRDEIILNGNSSFLYKPCYFCKDIAHALTNCPSSHYQPSCIKIISNSHFNDKIARSNFPRKFSKRKKFNALFSIKKIQFSVRRIQLNTSIEKKPKLIPRQKFSIASVSQDNTKKKSSIATSPLFQQREKKESIFNNNSDIQSNNLSSLSSYTNVKKKHFTDKNFLQNIPFASSKILINKKLNSFEDNKFISKNYTIKTSSSDNPTFTEDAYISSQTLNCTKNSNFDEIKNKPIEELYSEFPNIESHFEKAKNWNFYFPKDNFSTIMKKINKFHDYKNKVSLEKKKKEESIDITSSKINRIRCSEIDNQKNDKRRPIRKNKTHTDFSNLNTVEKENNRNFLWKIKSLFSP